MKNYDPPTKEEYPYLEPFLEAYNLGYKAYAAGYKQDNNPYENQLSHHERDSSSMGDECHYQWYRGYWDGYEDSIK